MWGLNCSLRRGHCLVPPPPPCATFRPVVVSLRGPGQSPVRPFACCVGSLLSVGRCGRCSCWCRFRVRGAQWLVCRGLCWMWRDVPFACQRRPINGVLRNSPPPAGFVWGPGQPRPIRPPTHIRNIFLRQKLKFIEGADFRYKTFFLASDPPPLSRGGGGVARQAMAWPEGQSTGADPALGAGDGLQGGGHLLHGPRHGPEVGDGGAVLRGGARPHGRVVLPVVAGRGRGEPPPEAGLGVTVAARGVAARLELAAARRAVAADLRPAGGGGGHVGPGDAPAPPSSPHTSTSTVTDGGAGRTTSRGGSVRTVRYHRFLIAGKKLMA